MNIYLLLGHPDTSSFDAALADAYEDGARTAGHEVLRHNVGDMSFDPILHKGYNAIQPLEPDLLLAQDNIKWCDHWVIVYPVWWGSAPALLRGYFHRILLPGFAFHPHENDPMWDKLLAGKSGHIITTSDAPNLYTLLVYRNSDVVTVKTATLGYCGIKPVKVTRFGSIGRSTGAQRTRHIERVRSLGSGLRG
ncbi:NAD(P)H-dependent oxidoreductase [Pelagibacterium limicola]|uniref:NAD(P)H-dependent oxidoreductase n=1 Tax=Pelagibacterium limicola TaxID=2791022 RepID=UPI0018AFA1CE|nr:NAD(P)H-dependent oxidoreductase [Pelagibacterium limicola]